MANLTNFSFEFFNEIFTVDASLLLLYYGAKKSKMTKNSSRDTGGDEIDLTTTVEETFRCTASSSVKSQPKQPGQS